MAYSQNYGGLIWTNHAIRRMTDRGINQEDAIKTFRNPDQARDGKEGSVVYERKFGTETISLVLKKNETREWLVISAWMDPPLPGTKDAKEKADYLAYRKATGLKKFFLLFKRQLGL